MVFGLNRLDLLGVLGISPPIWTMEILDIVIMTLALGFIFKHLFRKQSVYDPLVDKLPTGDFWAAVMAVAPAVILHELGHKFVALAMGVTATFYAAWGFLIFGLILKMINPAWIFLVPGYVAHSGGTPGQIALIAFAGPALNLILWQGSKYLMKHREKYSISGKYLPLLGYTLAINRLLFFFNMIPIRPFDGGSVLWGLMNI